MENKPNPTLVVSSLALSLPGILFVQRAEYIQAFISLGCCLFSILWHSTKPRYNWILLADMFFANSTALLAIHTAACGSIISLIPVSCFLTGGGLLYYYGQQNKCFLWSSNYDIATRWHAVLHVGNGLLGVWLVSIVNSKSASLETDSHPNL
jgi:hypothetical protein